MIKHLDLFSGIGGFALAAKTVWGDEYENVGFCDFDPFIQNLLKQNFPNAKIYGDIKELDARNITADLITGGFPCQPFSNAGKRRGSEDDRHLWPEMLRVIREVSPRWIIGENVGGLLTWDGGVVLDQIIADLEASGYEVWPLIIPACAQNSPQRRDRVWILANNEGVGRKKGQVYIPTDQEGGPKAQRQWADFWFQHFGGNHVEFKEEDESFICGMDDGLPDRVDRIKALGNCVVPAIPIVLMQAIKQIG